MYSPFRVFPLVYAVLLCMLLFGAVGKGFGQDKKRTYANFQGTYEKGLGLLGNPTLVGQIFRSVNAVNGMPQDSSTLTVPVGALNVIESTQFLEFTTNGQHTNVRNIPSGTAVTVKFSLPKELLGLLSSVSIGTYTNLNSVSKDWSGVLGLVGEGHNAGYNSTHRTEYYTGTSLLNLLNGAGQFEITFTPTSNYHGIYLSLTSLLSLGLSADLFHAYILEDFTYPDCKSKNEAIDLLSGVRAGTAVGGIASATGSISNPWNGIDGDASTFALMSTGLQALSEVYLNAIFATPSLPNQKVSILIQDQGTGLLDLSLLAGFTIQPYLGAEAVGDPITNASSLLSLRLLAGSGNTYELQVPVSGSFDRVEIKMGGVVAALTNLKIYEILRLPLFPEITSPDGQPVDATVCEGETASFHVSASVPTNNLSYQWQYQSENSIEWHDVEDDANNATLNVSNAPISYNNRKYKVIITGGNSECLQTIISSEATLTVNPKPSAPNLIINPHSQY